MNRLQAALLGGLFIGVVSALPIVNLLNACCCLWVVTGGALTTYLLHSQGSAPVATNDAAMTGLMAGAIGALISGVIALVMFLAIGDMSGQMRAVAEQLSQVLQLPPDAREQLLTFNPGPVSLIFSSLLSVPVYAVFAMAGALLALLVFRKPSAPPGQA